MSQSIERAANKYRLNSFQDVSMSIPFLEYLIFSPDLIVDDVVIVCAFDFV